MLLARMPILLGGGPEVLDELAQGARVRAPVLLGHDLRARLAAHRPVLRLQRRCGLMVKRARGQDKVVELFEPGGMFGEIGVFGARYRTWTQAVGRWCWCMCRASIVLAAVAMDNSLSNRMLVAVCARIQRLIDAIGSTVGGPAAVRVANYLLEQLERGARSDGCIVLPAPKKTIASPAPTLTPRPSRGCCATWSEEGVLTVSGRRIRVRNRAADSPAC